MTVPLAKLDVTNRVVKRAQYEAFEFSVDAVTGGVRVRNTSHADPANHEYLVTVQDGLPVNCECPADEHYEGACKHRTAVAIRRPLLDTLQTARLVADGGVRSGSSDSERGPAESDSESDRDDCGCASLPGDFPCWECYRTGRRDLPEE